jgi:hypothetical protein
MNGTAPGAWSSASAVADDEPHQHLASVALSVLKLEAGQGHSAKAGAPTVGDVQARIFAGQPSDAVAAPAIHASEGSDSVGEVRQGSAMGIREVAPQAAQAELAAAQALAQSMVHAGFSDADCVVASMALLDESSCGHAPHVAPAMPPLTAEPAEAVPPNSEGGVVPGDESCTGAGGDVLLQLIREAPMTSQQTSQMMAQLQSVWGDFTANTANTASLVGSGLTYHDGLAARFMMPPAAGHYMLPVRGPGGYSPHTAAHASLPTRSMLPAGHTVLPPASQMGRPHPNHPAHAMHLPAQPPYFAQILEMAILGAPGMHAANARDGRLLYPSIGPQQPLQPRTVVCQKPSCGKQKGGDRCWGFDLNGGIECDAAFRGVGVHLVDKFCSRCRVDGVLVLHNRIRTIPSECHGNFTNSHKEGFWTDSTRRDVPRFRLINQTRHCTGPRLVIFESDPPELPLLTPICSEFGVEPGRPGYIRLWLSKGTLLAERPNWVHLRNPGCGQDRKRQRKIATHPQAFCPFGGAAAATTPAAATPAHHRHKLEVATAVVAPAGAAATEAARGAIVAEAVCAEALAEAVEMEALARGLSEDRLSTSVDGSASPPSTPVSPAEKGSCKAPPAVAYSMASEMARHTVCQS